MGSNSNKYKILQKNRAVFEFLVALLYSNISFAEGFFNQKLFFFISPHILNSNKLNQNKKQTYSHGKNATLCLKFIFSRFNFAHIKSLFKSLFIFLSLTIINDLFKKFIIEKFCLIKLISSTQKINYL